MIIALVFVIVAALTASIFWGLSWRAEAELQRKHTDNMWKRLLEMVAERDRYADVLNKVHVAMEDDQCDKIENGEF